MTASTAAGNLRRAANGSVCARASTTPSASAGWRGRSPSCAPSFDSAERRPAPPAPPPAHRPRPAHHAVPASRARPAAAPADGACQACSLTVPSVGAACGHHIATSAGGGEHRHLEQQARVSGQVPGAARAKRSALRGPISTRSWTSRGPPHSRSPGNVRPSALDRQGAQPARDPGRGQGTWRQPALGCRVGRAQAERERSGGGGGAGERFAGDNALGQEQISALVGAGGADVVDVVAAVVHADEAGP